MSRPFLPLPGRLGPGFTASQAREAGVYARRLRHTDVTRVARGLYARTGLLTPEDGTAHPDEAWRLRQLETALAIAAALPRRLFFSGRTAAAIWGLPVRSSGSADLEVSTFQPHRAPRRAGLRAAQAKPGLLRVVEHRGLRVTDPASTWAMIAGGLDLRDGVALGDAVIRRARIPGTARLERPPLAAISDLERVVAAGRRKGVGRLREALPLLSPHSASPPESHLRLRLREWGVPDPELDFDVVDSGGRLLGCSEIAFPEFRLALEYEGLGHLIGARQWNRDIAKYRDYASAGWEALRVTAELLYRREPELRRQVVEALTRRGWGGAGR